MLILLQHELIPSGDEYLISHLFFYNHFHETVKRKQRHKYHSISCMLFVKTLCSL